MLKTKVGFIVYGVHKDGLKILWGKNLSRSGDCSLKTSVEGKGLELDEHDVIIATKKEAIQALSKYKKMTYRRNSTFSHMGMVSHLPAAIRDFATSGKAIVI